MFRISYSHILPMLYFHLRGFLNSMLQRTAEMSAARQVCTFTLWNTLQAAVHQPFWQTMSNYSAFIYVQIPVPLHSPVLMSNYVSEVVSVLSRSRQMTLCFLHSLYSLSGRGPQLAYYLCVSSMSICLSYKKMTFSGGRSAAERVKGME